MLTSQLGYWIKLQINIDLSQKPYLRNKGIITKLIKAFTMIFTLDRIFCVFDYTHKKDVDAFACFVKNSKCAESEKSAAPWNVCFESVSI